MKSTKRDNEQQFASDKIMKHTDRINKWLAEGTAPPITVEFSMTNKCNNKCPKCFGYCGNTGKDSEITPQDAEDIVLQVKQLGARAITFTGGGEPLCNKATPATIRYAKTLGLDAALITNGLLLNKKTAGEILPSLTWVRVSLDAASPGIYWRTHGMPAAAFNRVLKNISDAVAIKNERKLNATIGVGFLVGEESLADLVLCARLARDLGVDYIQYRPFLKTHRGRSEHYDMGKIAPLFEDAFAHATPTFNVLYSKHKYDSLATGRARAYGKCYGHHFATTISADYHMYVCCHLSGIKQYQLGNLKDERLFSIWYGKRRRQAYESINFADCPPLCRCNTFNEILWNIKEPREHVNFL